MANTGFGEALVWKLDSADVLKPKKIKNLSACFIEEDVVVEDSRVFSVTHLPSCL